MDRLEQAVGLLNARITSMYGDVGRMGTDVRIVESNPLFIGLEFGAAETERYVDAILKDVTVKIADGGDPEKVLSGALVMAVLTGALAQGI